MTNYLCGDALWQQVETVTKSALACGALKSIPTHCEIREVSFNERPSSKNKSSESKRSESTCGDSTVSLQIRVVENLERKSQERQQRVNQAPKPKGSDNKPFNPFLPYEPALYVGELTEHYRCLLNKFNVIDHHILMVTTKFVPQQTPLDVEDFVAAHTCLQAQDGLVFYNGGAAAGASVEHKHLQMIPFPIATGLSTESTFPFHKLLSSASIANRPMSTPLPFSHRVIATAFSYTRSMTALKAAAETNCKHYHHLLTELKLSRESDGMMSPHNMLMTRDALWVIPRSRESYQGLAINALGFAGTLLVKNQDQLQQLDKIGCLELLQAVSF